MFYDKVGRKMANSYSIKLLSELLLKYEKVQIDDLHIGAERVYFCLKIKNLLSFVRLAYFCRAANVQFEIYADSLPEPRESTTDTLERLVWQFSFSLDEKCVNSSLKMEIYGNFLVWDLAARGVLNSVEVDSFLEHFKGAKRTAKSEKPGTGQ